MICPKCKNQISENLLKCNHCGAKIATLCKKCNAYNSIYNLNCTNCGNELLKLCPSCKSVNLPNAPKCRKCGLEFGIPSAQNIKENITAPSPEPTLNYEEGQCPDSTIQENPSSQPALTRGEGENLQQNSETEEVIEQEVINLNYEGEIYSQQMAKELLTKGIHDESKKIISISGKKGTGKSIVLKSAIHELKNVQITWLLGECTPISQLSPCGLIQDALLAFFNITNFCSDGLKLKKESQKFFQSEFPTLTNDEIFNLLNFLYPTNSDYFENILSNKEKTFTMLKKVFKTIFENNKTVLIIENFDLIDGLSYEFLHNLLNSDSAKFNKIIITYNEMRPARGYLYNNKLASDAYLDISLGNFDKNQMNSFIDQHFTTENCAPLVKESLFKLSSGVPAILEQFVFLLLDHQAQNLQLTKLPPTLSEAVKLRLDLLKKNVNAYRLLSCAAIQGVKFYPAIINQVLKIEENEFFDLLNLLQKKNYIIQTNEFSYSFKNSMFWETLLDIVKQDKEFANLNENLFAVYSNYTLSSISILAVIAQNLNQNLSALNIWTDNTKIASYIGDTNLYAISQKQCLVLIEKLDGERNSLIKTNIYERLGKLLTKSNPKEAIEYLPKAIQNARKLEDTLKEIELTGYLANCCIQLGDYYGTIECIDAVINKLSSEYDLEMAMLKARKLDALLKIGNSGEIVNLADNEILPVFDKYINAKPHKNISISSIYKTWLQTYLNLANALLFQGDNRSFEVITTMFELFERNNFDDKLFICKTKLALAFANTIKGDVETSESILGEIIRTYKTDIMDNEAISRWNLINILNNFIHKKYTGLKEELFQVVSFAHNINDNFTKNILKTLLGKIFKDEDNAKRALEIYSEQITYFAKEKNGIGALLTWYLIAEADLIAEGPDKSLEVARKALDVSQSPKINNYLFMILYNKVIAEALMTSSEYELAKVHIEKAILIARKFELLNQLIDLYLLYGKYLQDIALVKTDAQYDYIVGASKMYKKAGLIAQGIKNPHLLTRVDKAKTVLNSFCQLNNITLKDI